MGNLPVSNLMVVTFSTLDEALHIQDELLQLQQDHAPSIDASVVLKDTTGKFRLFPPTERDGHSEVSLAELARYGADRDFIQGVMTSLPAGGAALFLATEDAEPNTLLVATLMLFAPATEPRLMIPAAIEQRAGTEEHFRADLETYRTAIAQIEKLDADSTEFDVEVAFKAVDDAYDRLNVFISDGLVAR